MDITIDQTKKLSEIQAAFSKRFPYLKIEFYNRTHAAGEGSHKENTIDAHLTIQEVQHKKAEGLLELGEDHCGLNCLQSHDWKQHRQGGCKCILGCHACSFRVWPENAMDSTRQCKGQRPQAMPGGF